MLVDVYIALTTALKLLDEAYEAAARHYPETEDLLDDIGAAANMAEHANRQIETAIRVRKGVLVPLGGADALRADAPSSSTSAPAE